MSVSESPSEPHRPRQRVALRGRSTGVLLSGVLVAGSLLAAPAAAAPAERASGRFTVAVDFMTATSQEAGAGACRVSIGATLAFTGTLSGTATGELRAVVRAPCSQATTTPPGTAGDVFRFSGSFTGTVDGAPTTGGLTYAGVTRVGGAVDARVLLSGPPRAALRADAVAGVGGTYEGVLP